MSKHEVQKGLLLAVEAGADYHAAKEKAAAFAQEAAQWDGPRLATEKLVEHYGARTSMGGGEAQSGILSA
jgi:hypothetical protein